MVTVTPESGVRETARLLLAHHISAVPVVTGEGRLVGIVSEADLMHRVETGTEHHPSWWAAVLADPEQLAHDYVKAHGLRAEDVMTRDIASVRPEIPVGEVADLLEKRHLRSLPVVQEGKVVGIVSRADLLRGLAARGPRPKAQGSVDDETIRKQLWRSIHAAEWLNAAYVHVSVEDGVVELWGRVDSNEQKLALGIATSSIPGVRAVEDHLAEIPAWAWAE